MTALLDPVKAGETFSFYLDATLDGAPDPSISSADVASHVRGRDGQLLTTLSIADVVGSPGRLLLTATPIQTLGWPVGFVYCDVRWIKAGVTMLTETLKIPVDRAVTV